MAAEILSVIVTVRIAGNELKLRLDEYKRGQNLPIAVPPGIRLQSAEHWPTGSTDPDRPQIRIEFGK